MRLLNTISMVSTTLWKLLAAPLFLCESDYAQMAAAAVFDNSHDLGRQTRLPDVQVCQAKALVFPYPNHTGSDAFVDISLGNLDSQFFGPTRANTILRSLSTCMSFIP